MKIDVDKIELVALDPKKFNLLLVRLPEGSTQSDVRDAHEALASVREMYGLPVLVVMPGYGVEFGTTD